MGDTLLKVAQIGLEATRGTAVAATRKFYAKSIELDQDDGIDVNKQAGTGTYHHRRGVKKGLIEAGSKITMPLDVRQILEFFQMAIKGGVTGAQQATTTAYLWDWAPTLATDDLKSATLEHNDSNKQWEMPFSMIDELTIKGAASNDEVEVEVSLFGKSKDEAALTGALAEFTIYPIQGWEAKLFIDALGATAFTTNKVGTLIDYEWKVKNNLARKYFGDNTRSLSKISRGDVEVDLSLTLETTTDANIEFSNYRSGTERLIGLELGNNRVIEGAYKEYVRLATPGVYTAAKLDEDNQTTVWKIEGKNLYDATNAYPFKASVMVPRSA